MFIGRDPERELLVELADRKTAGFAIVYGRRRIGKTELIREVIRNRDSLWFDGIEGRPKREQIDAFLLQLDHQMGVRIKPRPAHWRDVFFELTKLIKKAKRKPVIVFDEFQWMANHRTEIVADLKLVWDQQWSQMGVTLILCGSIASFMKEKVVRSKALYGRSDLVLEVLPFRLNEATQMLVRHGKREVLEAMLFTGGVPQYLDLVSRAPSVRIAMEELAFTRNGWLVEEYGRIFVSHFGKNADYERIVTALAAHPRGMFRNDLNRVAGVELGGRLTRHLEDLESAGFIASESPLDKPANSKLIRYVLSDAYLSFYHKFLLPKLKKIRQTERGGNLFQKLSQSGAFHAWMGVAFERLCMRHHEEIAVLLGFSGIEYRCGPFFRRRDSKNAGVQVDLLFDRADNVMTLCEMKFQNGTVGADVISEIEERAGKLQKLYPTKTIQRVLVHATDVTREVETSLALYRIIHIEELF